ncbi:MAG: RNA polymerase sigma factor [Myxococcota bacterium]
MFADFGTYAWRLLRYLGVPEADLEDALQEVFLVVHRKRSQVRPNSSHRAWIGAIATRVAADVRRKRGRRRARELPMAVPPESTESPSAHARIELEEARHRMLRALDTLKAEQRMVFVMHVVEEIPIKDVAEALGCALPTAYYRLERAREALRAAVQDTMEER